MWGRRALLTMAGLGLLGAPAAGLGQATVSRQARSPTVPHGFVGMMADGPMLYSDFPLGRQLARMRFAGVQRVRVEFNWSRAQPVKTWGDLPTADRTAFVRGPAGVPVTFVATDRIVSLAARHHLAVLPVVLNAPRWDASPQGNHIQPLHDAPYAAYMTALVHRYGSHGSFWKSHRGIPRVPITAWQVWDEPNLPYTWDSVNWGPTYVALLRAASRAIRHADPQAQVVLGSLAGASWRELPLIYAVHHARRLFDAVAANIYMPTPENVINAMRSLRRVMDSYGDNRKPLIATELGWPSALGKSIARLGVATTQRGQAKRIGQLLPLLAANRRRLGLESFFYYTWVSTDQVGSYSPFAFAGLLRYDVHTHRISAKPAFAAFRRVALHIEGRH